MILGAMCILLVSAAIVFISIPVRVDDAHDHYTDSYKKAISEIKDAKK
jgi:hypothetical protein